MADPTGEYGELTLRFPVFAVVTENEDDQDGLIVVEVEGQECIPLFLSREVAELYVEQAGAAGEPFPLRLREQEGDEALDHLLAQLPSSVGFVLWDATLRPQAVRMTAVEALRKVLRRGA
jgi:hypothetical protein